MNDWLRVGYRRRMLAAIGALLLVLSLTAFAQEPPLTRHDMPTWEFLVPYVFGVLFAALAAYAKGLSNDVREIRHDIATKKADSNQQITNLKERLITQHPTTDTLARAVRAELAPLELRISFIEKELMKLDAIHARLDRLHVPAPRSYQDDGA